MQHFAQFVTQWVVADEKPAVPAVPSACALLVFERLAESKGLPTLVLQPRYIFRMKDTRPKVRGHDLIDCEPRIFERRPIRVDRSSFRVQDDDGLRDRIDDPAQFLFIPA